MTHRHIDQSTDVKASDLVLTLKKEELLAVLNGDFALAQTKAAGECEPLRKLLTLCGM